MITSIKQSPFSTLSKSQIYDILQGRNANWQYSSLSSLPHPYQLKDCEQASACLAKAIEQQKQILIVGDYDVDGIVSSVIMMRFLRALGHTNASYIIPNRFKDGYGINEQILRQNPSDIVITVDNGISAFEVADLCAKEGRTLIITDHHLPKMIKSKQVLPNADFVINPQRSDCAFPQKEICGALVAWYFCAGVKIALQNNKEFDCTVIKSLDLASLLEFVLLATIADMMPLTHINKTIVLQGIKRLKTSQFPCINTLKTLLKTPFITASDIAFSITPLLNAAGRMGEGTIASEFLLDCDNVNLEQLKSINEERKECAKITLESALKSMREYPSAIIALGKWNEGVLGIVASQLAKRFQKCAFVLTQQAHNDSVLAHTKILKGSGRGLGNTNLVDLLSGAGDILLDFGGHSNAAGLLLEEGKYEEFCEYLASLAQAQDFVDEGFLGRIDSRDIDEELLEIIEQFEPYGQGNAKPIFEATLLVQNVQIIKEVHKKITFVQLDSSNSLDSSQNGNNAKHIQTTQNPLKAMSFFCDKDIQIGEILTARFYLQRDAYNGKPTMIITQMA